ncbi:MAG: helix-turn-helix transcriptional regulator [Fibrobacteres bacterium]|nr:helix-turn-helix transcriptional regulator [Fibrobacterota bacterium]
MWLSEQSQSAQRFGLEVLGLNEQSLGPNSGIIDNYRTLTNFALIYLVKGENEFESAPTGALRLKEGDIFFLFPGVAHRYGTNSHQKSFSYWYVFDGTIPRLWLKEGVLDPAQPIYSVGQNKNIRLWSADAVLQTKNNSKAVSDSVSRLLLCILHETLTLGVNPEAGAHKNTNVKNIITYMSNNMSEASFDMLNYCNQNRISYEYIRKAFRKTTGVSPAHYFSQLKLAKAKSLLVSTEETISRIGHTLGFEDPYYFSRWFRKQHGHSPKSFRESYRNFA